MRLEARRGRRSARDGRGASGGGPGLAPVTKVVLDGVLKPHAEDEAKAAKICGVHEIAGGNLLNLVEGVANVVANAQVGLTGVVPYLLYICRGTEGIGVAVIVRVREVAGKVGQDAGRVFHVNSMSLGVEGGAVGVEETRVLINELVLIPEAAAELEDAAVTGDGVGRGERCSEAEVDLGTVGILLLTTLKEKVSGVKDIDTILHVEVGLEWV